MNRKFLSFALIAASIVAAPLSNYADEGMWLPQDISKLPVSKMHKKGLKLNPEDIYRADGLSLKDAILRIRTGGSLGTGSFISSQGLVVTNHHVAFDGIAEVSTPQANYLEKGFVSKSRAEELPLKNYSVSITRVIKDVTQDILSNTKPGMSTEDRQKAIDQKRQELVEAAKKENANLDFEVVEMVQGLKFSLFGYEVFRDIRLVYAPPKSVGFFGGDDDNFLWPRHTGDYSFLRAYASPEGKPATYSEKNVPYQPQKFLSISLEGYKEGDFTMLMGHPGRTYRLRDSYSIEFQQNLYLPTLTDLLSERIALLDEAGKQDAAVQLKVASERFGLSNVVKNFTGAAAGLRRTQVVDQKRAEEAAFQRHIEESPELKQKYGTVISELGALYKGYDRIFLHNTLINGLINSSASMQFTALAVGRAIDHEKPASERAQLYADDRVERLKGALPSLIKDENKAINQRVVALYLNKALALPTDKQIAFINERFASTEGAGRQNSINDLAGKLTDLGDTPEKILKLLGMSLADMKALNDPAINLLIAAQLELDKTRKSEQEFASGVNRLRPLYIEGMTSFRKNIFYPDANATLRFSYGEVKGYVPRDGVVYTYLTTLKGVVDKDTGKEPFDVPAVLKDLERSHNFGPYADASVNDIPVAFLTNNDITGGSSGSAVLNGRGELIGLAFDGNYEGLGSDYGYNAEQSRTICVDIRYVLFLAEKMAGATNLLKELEIHGKGASAVAK